LTFFFKQFVNFVLNISAVHADWKFQFIGTAVSNIQSQTVATKLASEKVYKVLMFCKYQYV